MSKPSPTINDIPVIKIFLAGEGAVGKTTLVERFVTGVFNPDLIMSIGVNHSVKDMKTSNGRNVRLQIWDIGGEKRFRFVVPTFVKGSTAGIIAFDTSRYSTYLVLDEWLKIIREILPVEPIFLVGMKSDIEKSELDKNKYKKLKEKYKLSELIFTSSKTGENVEKTLQFLADSLPKKLEEDN